MTYATPGVYVEEISTFPPSVAEVSTAVPAFIGYTEKGEAASNGPQVVRINTLLEYETIFGTAQAGVYNIKASQTGTISEVTRTLPDGKEFLLYYALCLYFKNGGGSCYIVSVGNYTDAPAKEHFEDGLAALEKEDEPTLILLTDAVSLASDDYYALCQAALAQCKKLGDRFAVLDVKDGNVDIFRDNEPDKLGIGNRDLMYGAAYHPYLYTSLNCRYLEEGVAIEMEMADESAASDSAVTLASIKSSNTGLYNQIKTVLSKERVTLPPSAAVAGVYARVDRERGVWKAPANESLASVIGPVRKISSNEQEGLNIDPAAGKSVNAIRAFTGKGTLIWGARTLAGNDNEWRYVPVRRLFNMIEESCRKSTDFAVFEPNDTTTWLKVKAMIESFLYGLWEQGALAGSTPDAAYFVNVGLGRTMTSQDILEGRMIVEIGIAAVRPAEFIILRFSHKLQEA
jgi:hypothetical protein